MRFSVFILSFASASHAMTQEVKTFDELWQDFYKKSHLIQKATKEMERSTLSLGRAKRHWLPRVYLSGQVFSTDDPGQVFQAGSIGLHLSLYCRLYRDSLGLGSIVETR